MSEQHVHTETNEISCRVSGKQMNKASCSCLFAHELAWRNSTNPNAHASEAEKLEVRNAEGFFATLRSSIKAPAACGAE